MATHSKSERTARAGQGGGEVNQTAKWFLMIGILGTALVLAFVAAVATKQGGSSTSAVSAVPAAAAPANVATGGQYRLSAPNELDPDGSGAISVSTGPAAYRVSAPNEADPDGAFSGGAAPTSYPPYRVSPPNEQQPSGD
jgi:hypothetical protein